MARETALNWENILGMGDSQGNMDWGAALSNAMSKVTGLVGGDKNALMLALLSWLGQYMNKQQSSSAVSPSDAINASEALRSWYTNQANAAAVPQSTVDTARSAVTERGTSSPVSPTVTASTDVPDKVTATPPSMATATNPATAGVPAKQSLERLLASMPNKINVNYSQQAGLPSGLTNGITVPGTTSAPTPTVQALTQQPGRYNPYSTTNPVGTMKEVDPALMAQMMQMVTGKNQNTQWANQNLQNSLMQRFGR